MSSKKSCALGFLTSSANYPPAERPPWWALSRIRWAIRSLRWSIESSSRPRQRRTFKPQCQWRRRMRSKSKSMCARVARITTHARTWTPSRRYIPWRAHRLSTPSSQALQNRALPPTCQCSNASTPTACKRKTARQTETKTERCAWCPSYLQIWRRLHQ